MRSTLQLLSFLVIVSAALTGCGWSPRAFDETYSHHTVEITAREGALLESNWTLIGGKPVLRPTSLDSATLHPAGDAQLVIPARAGGEIILLSNQTDGIHSQTLPSLLPDLSPIAGAMLRERVYLIGSNAAGAVQLLATNLRQPGQWEKLGEVNKAERDIVAFTAQSDGERPHLFLFSRSGSGAATSVSLFEPERGEWRPSHTPVKLPAAFLAVPGGVANIFVLSQDGLGTLSTFNAVTRTLSTPEIFPWRGPPVAASVTGGELRVLSRDAGNRFYLTTSTYLVRAYGLRLADYAVIVTCGLLLLAVALFNSRRFRSADSYFRGGKNIPWFAAALSVVATGQSATSFISLPARAFATNLQFALVPLTNVFGAIIMSRYFVRFFVRLNVTSAYEYLEVRFSPLLRTIGSLNYLVYELARVSLLILVPAVALSAVTRIEIEIAIMAMGAIATIYTASGGLEGVVWADVIQIVIKVVSIVLVVVLIFAQLEGSPAELAQQAWREGKLRAVDWSFDLTRETIWAFLLFWLTDGLKSYVANQTIIQRFISTRDEKAAQRSIRASAVVGTLIFWTFLLAGIGLYLFYRQNPDRLDPMMDKPDAVFPWFIIFELPPGVTGLVITALVAAALSSLYGALNSTSTVIVTDFYRRYSPSATDERAVRLGRILTLLIGLGATMLSLLLSALASRSLIEQTLSILGLFGGGLGGLFLVGMLTTRVSAPAALVGILTSACVQFYVSNHTALHWLTYMFTGMGSCFVAAWLASWVWPEKKVLTGLTVHTSAR